MMGGRPQNEIEAGPTFREAEFEIEIGRNPRAVWDHWQLIDEFPRFMTGVRRVYRIDERRSLWEAEVGGRQQVWEAEIVESVPAERLAWRSVSGAVHSGELALLPLSGHATRVALRIRYQPRGLIEHLGVRLGLLELQVRDDLARCKHWIERGDEQRSTERLRRAPHALPRHRRVAGARAAAQRAALS